MKYGKLISAVALLVAVAVPVSLAAQEHKSKHQKYKLIDLGTFGGQVSYIANDPSGGCGASGSLSPSGSVVGAADTSIPDPNYPNTCLVSPLDPLILHAFRWQDGVLTDLGALPGVNSSFANWISQKGLVTGFSENGAIETAVASKWYVDGVNGSDSNNCKTRQHACKTIGHAISLASSGDSIMVAAATYTENLTIGFSLKIVGSGAKTTIIDGGGVNSVVTISNSSASVALSRLTIRNGREIGGGIYNDGMLTINDSTVSGNRGGLFGGGIYNNGTLTINNSTVSGNSAAIYGGGVYTERGTLTINNSTISGNSTGSLQGSGGGISNGAALTISNSTVSGNSANSYGGGISNFGTLTINNSTISSNHSNAGGGVSFERGTLTIRNSTLSGNSAFGVGGGGIYGGGATLQNSIVANNPQGGNCYGTMTSNGYNLSSDNTCNFNNTGDLNNTDPKLGQLGNHGGPTQTIPLLSGSPAIDAGNPRGCTDSQGHLLRTDQRGAPRPDKEDAGGCDMGAYERHSD